MVAITVTDHVPAERSFRVDVALTPAAGSNDIKDFGHANLDIKDADEVKLDFTLVAGTLVAERATTNSLYGNTKVWSSRQTAVNSNHTQGLQGS